MYRGDLVKKFLPLVCYAIYILILYILNQNPLIGSNEINPSLLNNNLVNVQACDLSGTREKNVKVDIGFGKRNYLAYTNDFSQVVFVHADTLELQNEENLSSNQRYCSDEAKVPGTELENFDQGHIIADSLGGVSNAYNITPESSYVNRFGAQAKLEKKMREELKMGASINNVSIKIYYPNSKTMIPVAYNFSYEIEGKKNQSLFLNKRIDQN